MNLLDKVTKFASQLRSEGNYRAAEVLYPIITELAAFEELNSRKKRLKHARSELNQMRSDLLKVGLRRLAADIDIIAQDLERKIIFFDTNNPIQSVLDSYKVLHRVASTSSMDTSQEILDLAEDDTLSDLKLVDKIKKYMLGLTLDEKKNILYVLEKDYNLSIPLEKVAFGSEKAEKKKRYETESKEEIEINECLEEAKNAEERAKCLQSDDKFQFPMAKSFPAGPSIWSGFAYEAIIPYSQSSQVNYWSLASEKYKKTLRKISRAPIDF